MTSKITLDMVNGLTAALAAKATPADITSALISPTLTIKGSTSPAPTAEGRIEWDTDDDRLVMGTGSGSVVFYPNAIITPWVPYTPTLTGYGTATGVVFRSRRVGGSLEVQGIWTSGTPTAVAASITLGFNGVNGGLQVSTINGTVRHIVGSGGISVATGMSLTVLAANGDAFVNLGCQSNSFGGLTIRNGSDFIASGQSIAVFFSVPILGW